MSVYRAKPVSDMERQRNGAEARLEAERSRASPCWQGEVFYMSVYRAKLVSDMKRQRMANFAISFDVPAAENVLH